MPTDLADRIGAGVFPREPGFEYLLTAAKINNEFLSANYHAPRSTALMNTGNNGLSAHAGVGFAVNANRFFAVIYIRVSICVSLYKAWPWEVNNIIVRKLHYDGAQNGCFSVNLRELCDSNPSWIWCERRCTC